jgi:hypothetical protein
MAAFPYLNSVREIEQILESTLSIIIVLGNSDDLCL